MTSAERKAIREALLRACEQEGVDPSKLEGFIKVSNASGFENLNQSRWVRVTWRLFQDSTP